MQITSIEWDFAWMGLSATPAPPAAFRNTYPLLGVGLLSPVDIDDVDEATLEDADRHKMQMVVTLEDDSTLTIFRDISVAISQQIKDAAAAAGIDLSSGAVPRQIPQIQQIGAVGNKGSAAIVVNGRRIVVDRRGYLHDSRGRIIGKGFGKGDMIQSYNDFRVRADGSVYYPTRNKSTGRKVWKKLR